MDSYFDSLKRVPKSAQVVAWYRSSFGTDFDNSEMAGPELCLLKAGLSFFPQHPKYLQNEIVEFQNRVCLRSFKPKSPEYKVFGPVDVQSLGPLKKNRQTVLGPFQKKFLLGSKVLRICVFSLIQSAGPGSPI